MPVAPKQRFTAARLMILVGTTVGIVLVVGSAFQNIDDLAKRMASEEHVSSVSPFWIFFATSPCHEHFLRCP